MRVLLAAALVAMAGQVGTARGAGSCSLVTAKRLLARTSASPRLADKVICADLTRDGRVDLAVTVASGGTAGDVAFVVFRRTRIGWKLSLFIRGYKLGLFRVDGDLVSSQPIYRKNDSNCCPTGGFDHTRWHWNGTRFIPSRTYHTKSFQP